MFPRTTPLNFSLNIVSDALVSISGLKLGFEYIFDALVLTGGILSFCKLFADLALDCILAKVAKHGKSGSEPVIG